MKNINCFIPFRDEAQAAQTVANLKGQELVNRIFLLHVGTEPAPKEVLGCRVLEVPGLNSTTAVKAIAQNADTDYTLITTKYTTLSLVWFALERMENLIEDAGAAMVYADHFNQSGDVRTNAPVIDCQFGALRDDFDFGSLLFYRTSALKEAVHIWKETEEKS